MRSTAKRLIGALAGGLLLVLALPGVASASVALPDGVVVYGTTGNDYTYTTSTPYWSVVAVQPRSGDVDMVLYSGSTALNSSVQGTGRTDFVAVNSNPGARPLGAYHATVNPFSGSASHAVQLLQGRNVIILPVPANDGVSGAGDPDITFAVLSDDDVASVADIYLTAGQKFWAHTTSAGDSLYLLETNPASATTFTRSRTQAAGAGHAVVDGCTLYTAAYTGWHGLAVVDDRWPTGSGGAGIAYALHKWNPAKPTTCPVKNFPGPTPA